MAAVQGRSREALEHIKSATGSADGSRSSSSRANHRSPRRSRTKARCNRVKYTSTSPIFLRRSRSRAARCWINQSTITLAGVTATLLDAEVKVSGKASRLHQQAAQDRYVRHGRQSWGRSSSNGCGSAEELPERLHPEDADPVRYSAQPMEPRRVAGCAVDGAVRSGTRS